MQPTSTQPIAKDRRGGIAPGRLSKRMARNYELYLMFLPVLAFYLIFHYWPMYGVQIAFKDFSAFRGIAASPWVGLKHFLRFFESYYFGRLIRNTLAVSLYALAVSFPTAILLALMLNEVQNKRFKKLVQTVTYAPHFISVIVLVAMLYSFFNYSSGLVNTVLAKLGRERYQFIQEPAAFRSMYVLSGVWQHMGWNSIIYMAALSGLDPELYESATLDGASRLQKIVYITIPGILPTIITMLILDSGRLMSVGFEKVFLMQNDLNLASSDVISTYVYRVGLLNAQYSFSTAIGLFNSVINCVLLVLVNTISRRLSETSLW